MDAQTRAWIDQDDAQITTLIRQHGWTVLCVGGGECSNPACDGEPNEGPPFAYTIGLFGMGHPELLIFGTPASLAQGVCNTLGERIRAGDNLIPGQLLTFDEWTHRIVPEEVPNPGEIVFGANRHYQRPSAYSVPVLQLSYDDRCGRFPWEPDYATPDMQPRPGTFRA